MTPLRPNSGESAGELAAQEPQAVTFGPMVHRFGHRRPDEWDIPFYEWTILRATDIEGREHIFEVPTAALRAATPRPDVARLREALEALERIKASAIENHGHLTPGAILDIQTAITALAAADKPSPEPARDAHLYTVDGKTHCRCVAASRCDFDCDACRAQPDHSFKDEWAFQRRMSSGNPAAEKPIPLDQPCFVCGVAFAIHGAALATPGDEALRTALSMGLAVECRWQDGPDDRHCCDEHMVIREWSERLASPAATATEDERP